MLVRICFTLAGSNKPTNQSADRAFISITFNVNPTHTKGTVSWCILPQMDIE